MSESKKPSRTPKVAEATPLYLAGGKTVSATDAKNKFADVLEAALRDGPVFIAKHGTPKAVLISVEEYERLTGPRDPLIEAWRKKYEAMVERMQGPENRAAWQGLMNATPEQLGAAAVEGAKRRE